VRRFDPELIPTAPDLSLEQSLWRAGIVSLAGIDEAGRGALAGPVAAAAVVLPADRAAATRLQGVRDSKQMTAQQREAARRTIQEAALTWGVGFAEAEEIDRWGIVPATRLAMQRALDSLSLTPGHLLLDYMLLPDCPIPQTSMIKGDQRSLSIAAASVLAKTARDARMCDFSSQYPEYGFAGHKGYGTRLHLEALARSGPCPLHRRSFAPLKALRDAPAEMLFHLA
jgi:ribonuclease HII